MKNVIYIDSKKKERKKLTSFCSFHLSEIFIGWEKTIIELLIKLLLNC